MFSDSVLLFRLSLSQFSLTTLQGSVCTRVWVKWMVSNRVVKHSSLRPRAKFEGHFLATLNVTDIVNTCLTVGFDCFLSEKPPSPLNWRVVVTNRWNVSSHFQLLGVFYCVSHVPAKETGPQRLKTFWDLLHTCTQYERPSVAWWSN